MRLPRFFVPYAAPGKRCPLPTTAAHHARNVLRLRSSDPIRVFDGRGHEFNARIEGVEHRDLWIQILEPLSSPCDPGFPITLVMPFLKGDRSSLIVQKCTELGVHAIWPVHSARTGQAGRWDLRRERWERMAVAAAEQCGRSIIPFVAPPRTFAEILALPFDGYRLLCVEEGGGAIEARGRKPPNAALACIGPAGGWTSEETSRALDSGLIPVTLGPRVLRAETAAIVIVAMCQFVWGDMRTPRTVI